MPSPTCTQFFLLDQAIQTNNYGIMPMDCMDSINLGNCLWFEGRSNKRNVVAGIISGLLFALGWWLIIDAMAVNSGVVPCSYLVCGVVGTFSIFMINHVPYYLIRDGDPRLACLFGERGTHIRLFVGFVLGFAAMIAACCIFIVDFAAAKDSAKSNMMVGVEFLFHNAMIFAASLIYKLCRDAEDQW